MNPPFFQIPENLPLGTVSVAHCLAMLLLVSCKTPPSKINQTAADTSDSSMVRTSDGTMYLRKDAPPGAVAINQAPVVAKVATTEPKSKKAGKVVGNVLAGMLAGFAEGSRAYGAAMQAYQPVVPGAITPNYMSPAVSSGGSSTQIGNTTYYSGGGSTSRIGNTWYHSGGGSSTMIGNTIYHSGGGSASRIGNTWYHSGGGSSTMIGNTMYHSGGGSSTRIGNTTYHSPSFFR
jgi:hypothetical protein